MTNGSHTSSLIVTNGSHTSSLIVTNGSHTSSLIVTNGSHTSSLIVTNGSHTSSLIVTNGSHTSSLIVTNGSHTSFDLLFNVVFCNYSEKMCFVLFISMFYPNAPVLLGPRMLLYYWAQECSCTTGPKNAPVLLGPRILCTTINILYGYRQCIESQHSVQTERFSYH